MTDLSKKKREMDIYTVARAGAIGFVAGAGLYATCSYVYSRYFKDQGTNSGSNYNAPVSKEPVDPPATPIQTIEPEPSALPITRQPLPSFDDSPAPQDSAPFPIASPPEDEWDKRMNPPRREELFEPIHTIEPESSALSIPRQPLPSFEDSPAHQDSAPFPIASPPEDQWDKWSEFDKRMNPPFTDYVRPRYPPDPEEVLIIMRKAKEVVEEVRKEREEKKEAMWRRNIRRKRMDLEREQAAPAKPAPSFNPYSIRARKCT